MTSCNESTTAWLSSGISLGTPGGGIDIVSKVSPVGSGLSLEFTLEPGKISKRACYLVVIIHIQNSLVIASEVWIFNVQIFLKMIFLVYLTNLE